MRVLVVAATVAELTPLVKGFGRGRECGPRATRYDTSSHDIDVLVSGVGMVATAAWCSRALLREPYDLALNVGVCGSFNPALEPGAVVHVVRDRFSELGAQDGESFQTIQQMGLVAADEFPFERGELINRVPPDLPLLRDLPAVSGITVNTVHGHDPSIAAVKERFRPDVESMEGAAFMYACLIQGLPFAQIRAVSNRVERRNRAAWKLSEAIAALNTTVRGILEHR